MEPLSCAASVMAIIQLTGSIATICGGYIKEAKDAREEITSLQQGVTNLLGTFKKLEELVHSQDGKKLSTSEILVNEVTRCESVLTLVRKKIDPENTRKSTKAMRRLGLRALKWPLKRAEIESIIQDLERFKSSFIFALQVDQTFYGLETSQTSKRIEQIIDLEALPIVHGAEFNSYKDQHESECLPGTRTELCREIKEWAMSSNAKTIFWLNVLAGTGKSTISRTMAKSFHQDGLLGASFFFKRGEGDRGNATKFFPTITRQLVSKIPELLPAVKKALQDEPRIAHTPLKNQFENLVLQPLSTLDNITLQTPTLVIVLDALDECDNNDDIRAILRLLPRVQESTSLRLRVFVTSRPELPIRLGFRDVGTDHQDLILHEVSEPIVKHDISLFLKHKLATIRQERRLPPDWPGDENFQTLVRMSVPLFIFAATICRVFEDHYLDPLRSLNNILKYQTQESKLDATYLPVLERVVEKYEGKTQEDLIQDIQKIVGTIILLASPLSVTSLSELMGISIVSINTSLNPLHSVLNIPNDETLPVRLFHLSFRDFLLDPYTRGKSPIWVDEKTTQETITAKCLSVMCKSLKKNMCNLQSYGMERRTMDSLAVSRSLPPELQYACRYWVHHLTHSESPKSWVNDIQAFLDEHFLHWMEVMSFLGLASEIVEGVSTLQSVLQGDNGSELSEFLFDAKRFTLKNSQIADISPLQIYASGLIFAPEMSITRRKFEKDLPNWIKKGPKIEENWSPELQTLEGHSSSVLSVAFSPDSRLLASGSSDNTIKLWDPASGALKYTLEGHSNWVQSVAFSPDGRLLASGSYDNTIKLWDPASGALKHTLESHSNWVQSVAFSPDGRLLASGSSDNTIKLWDPASGALRDTLEGHSAWVLSATFSPDGRLLASGSSDNTIKLWDPASGALKHTLEGHSSSVQSVAFSTDSRLLVSCSLDKTIKLWDPASGALRHTLEGHSAWALTVAFSTDSRLLASCSLDKTIKLWDPASGALKHTLEGHSDLVQSVAFSPDGRLLASGSEDKTIKLWDPSSGALRHTLEGHSDLVQSVAFSSDGRLLASGSEDKTIKLWDPASGALRHTLEGHFGSVLSVTFSPDGRLLAFGSHDKTIKLWDPASGALKHTLEGHSNWVQSVAFSPDGRLLASGSSDNTIKLWNPASGALRHTLEGHSDRVLSVTFSPGGRLLASGSSDKTIKLWDPASGALKHTLEGHSHWVQSVTFSPGSRLLASSSYDKTIKLWDPASGALKHTINTYRIAYNIEFSKELPRIITNLGSFNIPAWHESFTSNSSKIENKISLQGGRWIEIRGQRELWLPPDYQAVSSAVKDGTIAFGCRSGRVCIIQFFE